MLVLIFPKFNLDFVCAFALAPLLIAAVNEPRAVLREFGLDIPPGREVRVWDSSAEMRYMVLPERPAGIEHMGEAELVPLIGRDALIGVAPVQAPAGAR